MNRVSSFAFRVAVPAIILFFGLNRLPAQAQAQAPQTQPQAPASSSAGEEDGNPFVPDAPPALPPGMAGSDINDPRAKLAAGVYDAGEASMGMKHLLLLRKPEAFQ